MYIMGAPLRFQSRIRSSYIYGTSVFEIYYDLPLLGIVYRETLTSLKFGEFLLTTF